jgi:hypothetical protein
MYYALFTLVGIGIPALLGAVLSMAGITKLADLQSFFTAISQYNLLPFQLIVGFGWVILMVEISVGGLLVMGFYTGPCCAIAAILFIGFSLAVAVNLLRGRRDISCGCFGTYGSTISWSLVFRNIILAGLALTTTLLRARIRHPNFGRLGSASISATCVVLVALLLAVASMRNASNPVAGSDDRGVRTHG